MKFLNRHPPLIARIVQLSLAVIFFYAGATKLSAPHEMAATIIGYQILPSSWVWLFAISLPLIECNLGLMLLTGIRLRVSALGVTILSAIFTLAVAQAWIRGLDIDCNCFGAQSAGSLGTALVRDIALCLASSWILILSWKEPT